MLGLLVIRARVRRSAQSQIPLDSSTSSSFRAGPTEVSVQITPRSSSDTYRLGHSRGEEGDLLSHAKVYADQACQSSVLFQVSKSTFEARLYEGVLAWQKYYTCPERRS